MQKFRRGEEWWGFHPERGWLFWDGSVNDWVARDDGPMPWVKSPFKRRRRRKLSEREAAIASLVPTNDDETRLLAHVLAEPPADRYERIDGAAIAAGVTPGNDEESRLLNHVLAAERTRRRPMAFPRPRPRALVGVLLVARAIGVAGAAVLLYVIVRGALAVLDMMFLTW